MPNATAVPIAWRISAPGPTAITSGMTPKMKAKLVIRIGRRRERAAWTAASNGFMPCSSSPCRANSTIRIAFLAASAISTIRPTWVRILLSSPRRLMPVIAASTHIGTIRITASGRVSDSYCAASTMNTHSTAMAKIERRGVAGRLLLVGEAGPFEGEAGRQVLRRELLHRRAANRPTRRPAASGPAARRPDNCCSASPGPGRCRSGRSRPPRAAPSRRSTSAPAAGRRRRGRRAPPLRPARSPGRCGRAG